LQHVSSSQHNIGIQFIERPWEQLRGIPVDREGEYVFSLRPRTDKYPNRLLCEVKVIDNIKIVTIRSTYKVENMTLYPIELMLVDEQGHPVYSLEKVAPGQEFSLPIEAVTKNRIRIQPDRTFSSCVLVRNELTPEIQRALGTNGALPFGGKTLWRGRASPSSALTQIPRRQPSGCKHGFKPMPSSNPRCRYSILKAWKDELTVTTTENILKST
jgi:hypothetical protein